MATKVRAKRKSLKPIQVDQRGAAALLTWSVSQIEKLRDAGLFPRPVEGVGHPRWCVRKLELWSAMGRADTRADLEVFEKYWESLVAKAGV